MLKSDFSKKYPDVVVQNMNFDIILSRADIEKKVLLLVNSLETGLLGYEVSGKKLKVFRKNRVRTCPRTRCGSCRKARCCCRE